MIMRLEWRKTMIESIKFENFCGFESLELSDMRPITLISGKNNVGKSSVLEGVFLLLIMLRRNLL